MNYPWLFTMSSLHLLLSRAHALEPYGGVRFERSANVLGGGCTDLSWTFDGESMDLVMAATSAPDADWLGVGFSEFGSMKGADIAMVIWDEINGEFNIVDTFSHDFELPSTDLLQNYELVDAKFDDEGRIQAIISRKANTCDADDLPVTLFKQHLICASGLVDASGTPMYHGSNRGSAYVNVAVDHELPFGRNISYTPSGVAHQLAPLIVAHHDDPDTATSPFPVDIELPEMVLDDTETTIYCCVAITMPLDFRVISWEAVWGDGMTAEDHQLPAWMHHEELSHCVNPTSDLSAEQLSGKPFDCMSEMPCSSTLTHAQTGAIMMPPAAHMPIQQ